MRSLRTTVLAGVLASTLVLVGGFGGAVYARSSRAARASMDAALRIHAEALAGLLEISKDGTEFETRPGVLTGFEAPGSGAYAAICAPDGRMVVKSPSLGAEHLPPPPPWEEGLLRYDDLDPGPGGIPCSMVTMAFTARPEAASGDWTPPPETERRYRIQVALDRRALDAGLRGVAIFLLSAGGAALALALGAGLLLARLVLLPVERMTREAAALSGAEAGRRLRPGTVVKELDSLAGTLNSALDRLAGALETQRRFASDASHELRTPLSVLMAGAEHLLRRPRTPDQVREGLERQLRTVRRMKAIVENLLTLARADGLPGEIGREPVPLGAVLEGVCEEFQPLADERAVRIVREIDGDAVVAGNRRLLGQLAGNLLSNAVKFTPGGGTVTVSLSCEGEEARLSVADTGPGIPEEDRARVFERFFRVGAGRNPAEGAGLGLAISDWIVRAHGGTIAVEPVPGAGARLVVRVPLLREPVPA